MSSRPILGTSKAVQAMSQMIDRVAHSKINVLVIGESGTGKELVARMIHDSGPLKDQPFIPVNCGAIPENLIESEMFGHKKGSFTGAVSDKPGLFEVANGGTLFLDEVGELPLSMQVKLLRAIQERTIRKVGGTDTLKVDVRIIAATNRDLEEAVRKGTFREDLYYRLNVVLIRTPPLRERDRDIEILAKAFLEKFNEKQKKNLKGFQPEVMKAYFIYSWPGNIREFENVVERAVTLESSEWITLATLPPTVLNAYREKLALGENLDKFTISLPRLPRVDFSEGAFSLNDLLVDIEKAYVQSAQLIGREDAVEVARWVQDTPKELDARLKRLGLMSTASKPAQKTAEKLKANQQKSKKAGHQKTGNNKRRK